MLLTMLCLTLVVFYLVNLEPNLKKLAISQTEMHASTEQLESWLVKNGYRQNFFVRYAPVARRLAEAAEHRPGDRQGRCRASRCCDEPATPTFSGVLQGDFGCSTKFKVKVVDKLVPGAGGDRHPDVLGAWS